MALAPKALETLLALIEHRDRVAHARTSCSQRIWGDTVVEEGGLTRNISILRKALGEKPDDHRYIVTVPGRGYRFVADVRESWASRPRTAGARSPDERARRTPAPRGAAAAMALRVGWLLGGLAALAAAALVYALRSPHAGTRDGPRSPRWRCCRWTTCRAIPSQEYFADGMTEALIGNLARIRALRVVSRTSVMRFKGAARPLPEIARALNVDAVVEGSVQRSGDRVRINVQLIHAATDTHLWAREYERELTDVLKLQGEVARAVADEIQVQITAEERARLASAGAVNAGGLPGVSCWASTISGG